ncbi:hypothetical protein HD554DRAFT_2104482, partial [Boletus coccyginus]
MCARLRVRNECLDSVNTYFAGSEHEARRGGGVLTYTSIEAPPSLLPFRHYSDFAGLQALYTDPRTGPLV